MSEKVPLRERIKNAWFWVKVVGLVAAVIAVIYLIKGGADMIKSVFQFFGFTDDEKNSVLIDKITKVDTSDQGKTEDSASFLEMMKENYK